MVTLSELLSLNLKRLRENRGLSQEKLAEIADVGIDIIVRAEGKSNFPRQDKITAIALALSIPETELFRPIGGWEAGSETLIEALQKLQKENEDLRHKLAIGLSETAKVLEKRQPLLTTEEYMTAWGELLPEERKDVLDLIKRLKNRTSEKKKKKSR